MDNSVLKQLQMTEIEILKEAIRICDKYNLTYYFVGGTLLGAVRHKGFIPWDDDLDIGMPRQDYEQFIKVAMSELSPQFYLHCDSTDDTYWLPFSKLKKNNTLFDEIEYEKIDTNKGIFIDIFPLDYTDKINTWYRKYQIDMIHKINRHLRWMKGLDRIGGRSDILHICISIIPSRWLKKLRKKLMMLDNKHEHKYVINIGSNYSYLKQTMPIGYYYPFSCVSFEGGEYKAPHDSVAYLKHLFGNWETMPPESERRNHNSAKVIFNILEEENAGNA